MDALIKLLEQQLAAVMAAPIPFIIAVLLGSAVVWGGMEWKYGAIIGIKDTEISHLKGEIERYKVALGIEAATPSALLQLDTEELQAKSATIVKRLRELNFAYNDRVNEIRSHADFDEQKKKASIDSVQNDLGRQFIVEMRSDAFNVDFELRRRLGPKAVAGIIGITPSIVANDGTRINIQQLMPAGTFPGFDLVFTRYLADGIEQMSRLLPPDKK